MLRFLERKSWQKDVESQILVARKTLLALPEEVRANTLKKMSEGLRDALEKFLRTNTHLTFADAELFDEIIHLKKRKQSE